jgi:hypothetical protein
MAWAEDRMSTQVVSGTWLPPDERDRDLDEDYELGPFALNDTSLGVAYQVWHLTWEFATGDFTVTPETVGSPVVVINAADVTQCSLCFDQNAHVTIAYTLTNGQVYLYWYDTVAAMHVTTLMPSGMITPTLMLDDKRATQVGANDVVLWWTEDQGDETFNLYRALQRDRFDPLVPKEMATGVPPYLYKGGMHDAYRVQLGLSNDII